MPNTTARRGFASAAGNHFKQSPPWAENADANYVRARDLPRLVPLWPSELERLNRTRHARLLAKLRCALRTERQRGISGHWAYDLARHAQLLRAYRVETVSYLKEAATAPDLRRGNRK